MIKESQLQQLKHQNSVGSSAALSSLPSSSSNSAPHMTIWSSTTCSFSPSSPSLSLGTMKCQGTWALRRRYQRLSYPIWEAESHWEPQEQIITQLWTRKLWKFPTHLQLQSKVIQNQERILAAGTQRSSTNTCTTQELYYLKRRKRYSSKQSLSSWENWHNYKRDHIV